MGISLDASRVKLSFVIPAFNEQQLIYDTARSADRSLSSIGLSQYEIILVDDGSTDGTGKRMREASRDFPQVRISIHDRNEGYGAAIMTGISSSRFKYIAYTDADLQFDIGEFQRMLEPLPEFDMVVGYRQRHDEPFHRRCISKGYNTVCRILFALEGLKDIDCSMKIFDRKIPEEVEITSNRFAFDLELVARTIKKGFSITQLPVSHSPRRRGKSTVSFREIMHTVWEIQGLVRHI